MAGSKLSAKASEIVEYLETVLKEAEHFGVLVEQYAAAKKGGEMYAAQLSRELGHLRQKTMARNLGFIADSAGQLAVMASRGGSPMMKARMLRDAVVAFRGLIERTLKGTITADENDQKEKTFLAEKERKTQAEHVRARVLAEEAREAAKDAVVQAPPAGAPGVAPASRPPAGAGQPVAPAPAPGPSAPSRSAVPAAPQPAAARTGAQTPPPAPPAAPAAAPAQPKAAEPTPAKPQP